MKKDTLVNITFACLAILSLLLLLDEQHQYKWLNHIIILIFFVFIIEGLEWALETHVNIINMSFGGVNKSQILENVINKANTQGILLISSVGNSGEKAVTYPAAYDNVIGVGASNYYNHKTSFTNFGKELELIAPGVNLTSFNQNGG